MKIEADDVFEGSVRRLARHWLRRVAHVARAASKGEVDAVHDTRAGLRRLRTILALSDDPRAQRLRKRSKRFAMALGAVRDLDVALQLVEQSIRRGELFLEHDVVRWQNSLAEERKAELRALRRVLRGGHFRAWRRRLRAWSRRDAAGPTISDALPLALGKLIREVQGLANPKDEPERHELRKAIKRVRYVLEFYDDVFSANARTVADRLTEAQDALGEQRDRLTLAERAERWARAAEAGDDIHELLTYERRLRDRTDDPVPAIVVDALEAARAVHVGP